MQTDYKGEVNLHIFDMKGRLLKQELVNFMNENVNVINNINLTPGVYPVVLSSPNNLFLSKTFKLIIQ